MNKTQEVIKHKRITGVPYINWPNPYLSLKSSYLSYPMIVKEEPVSTWKFIGLPLTFTCFIIGDVAFNSFMPNRSMLKQVSDSSTSDVEQGVCSNKFVMQACFWTYTPSLNDQFYHNCGTFHFCILVLYVHPHFLTSTPGHLPVALDFFGFALFVKFISPTSSPPLQVRDLAPLRLRSIRVARVIALVRGGSKKFSDILKVSKYIATPKDHTLAIIIALTTMAEMSRTTHFFYKKHIYKKQEAEVS